MTGKAEWLGSVFSDVALDEGDIFSRPTAGSGELLPKTTSQFREMLELRTVSNW